MTRESIFLDLGFDNSLEPAFRRLWEFIEAPDGCNGYIYIRANLRMKFGPLMLLRSLRARRRLKGYF